MERSNNTIRICGVLAGRPEFSHAGREGSYYRFPLAVRRLSGTDDVINVIAHETLLHTLEPEETQRLRVLGEVRSFNNKSAPGPKLVISVLARAMEFTDDDFENSVTLSGTLCKPPNLRRTPMGREICDMMLAVNRRYGRSDYLPCIAWGTAAHTASRWDVGTEITLSGRLQSRVYIKTENDGTVEKTAFEISAVELSETC